MTEDVSQVSKGWLKASQHPEWYIYRQQSERGQWTGVVCNLDLALSAAGGLQTHEQTLDHRESLFASFLETVGFHAEPILCARPDGTAEALAAVEAPDAEPGLVLVCREEKAWLLSRLAGVPSCAFGPAGVPPSGRSCTSV